MGWVWSSYGVDGGRRMRPQRLGMHTFLTTPLFFCLMTPLWGGSSNEDGEVEEGIDGE